MFIRIDVNDEVRMINASYILDATYISKKEELHIRFSNLHFPNTLNLTNVTQENADKIIKLFTSMKPWICEDIHSS